ncbi:MAG: hypothetical protein COB36_01510 [Alphaproteobacteria bacterium]|nr:MAG: hypothetical protein COB36_01510 [Alphaproteobacteria bacterium]
MSVDYKTAKHICNVIRRQIQSGFPDLYINFIVHAEDKRKQAFSKEKEDLSGHPAGDFAINHLQDPQYMGILEKNRSCFSILAYDKQPGFLGFFQSNSYLSIFFINHERFQNEDNLRNHAFHLAWHAIALYRNVMDTEIKGSDNTTDLFKDSNNILRTDMTSAQWKHRNLQADIFSASIQTLQGRGNTLDVLSKQRMSDTLHATPGFVAENFPFPVCLDTLDFVFKNKISQYKKSKKSIIAATEIAEEIGKAYDDSSIEQWRSFSIPAQEMAWLGHSPKSILGAAIYTSENTYAQSIADMLAERMDIKPEVISTSQEYNPFTAQEANERIHKKQCNQLIDSILNKIHEEKNHAIIMEVIQKQNIFLQNTSLIGWCSSALIQTKIYIEQSDLSNDIVGILKHARTVFQEEVDSIPWDTLMHFSRALFNHRRNHINQTMDDIINIADENDEFASIYHVLTTVNNAQNKTEANDGELDPTPNISNFISPNAIKGA